LPRIEQRRAAFYRVRGESHLQRHRAGGALHGCDTYDPSTEAVRETGTGDIHAEVWLAPTTHEP